MHAFVNVMLSRLQERYPEAQFRVLEIARVPFQEAEPIPWEHHHNNIEQARAIALAQVEFPSAAAAA